MGCIFNTDIELTQLICLFVLEPEIDQTLSLIGKTYDVLFKRIFILAIEDSEELLFSFNVEKDANRVQLPGAMLVHRKKETNTLYTINSLNALIKMENNGKIDVHYNIDWSKYMNSFLVTSNNELKVLHTKVHRIVNL